VVANLPRRIAERELAVIKHGLEWPDDCLTVEEAAGSRGPGNIVSIEIEGEYVTEVVTSFGQKGVKAETVAERAVQAVGQYLAADVPVGRNLADQLLIPLALAGGGSFMTLTPSQHTKTNADVLQRFLDVRIELTARGEQQWLVQVS
jgi:RNA 3'-terminal phosphate cyclase (ATP)